LFDTKKKNMKRARDEQEQGQGQEPVTSSSSSPSSSWLGDASSAESPPLLEKNFNKRQCTAASLQLADQVNDRAEHHYRSGDYVNALTLYREAAMSGHAGAQNDLALMLECGLGVARRSMKLDGQAFRWYRAAARQFQFGADVSARRMQANIEERRDCHSRFCQRSLKELCWRVVIDERLVVEHVLSEYIISELAELERQWQRNNRDFCFAYLC
jgi:TPR repeat protein